MDEVTERSISIVRCGSFDTIGTPVGESLPLTTQLLLPSSSCALSTRARAAASKSDGGIRGRSRVAATRPVRTDYHPRG